MSYICGMCSARVKSGETLITIATQVRDVTYVTRSFRSDDKVTKGVEIVKEEKVCQECMKRLGGEFKPQVVSEAKRESTVPRPAWDKDRRFGPRNNIDYGS